MAMPKRSAQSTVEYAILAAVVVAALLVMQIYMKRGFSGKLKESTDRVGEQFTPASATYELTNKSESKRRETTTSKGVITSATLVADTQTRSGQEEPSQRDIKVENLWSK